MKDGINPLNTIVFDFNKVEVCLGLHRQPQFILSKRRTNNINLN